YSDNKIEGVVQRSLLYITDNALNAHSYNVSRGMVMAQLLRFMGYREEHLRPDAPSYIQRIDQDEDVQRSVPRFSNEQLQWPFDPESITIPPTLRNHYGLTIYCPTRRNSDIGAGQRVGLLTRLVTE
ncbi:Protein C01F1.5, partial [Aphelenchoides avenae]